MKPTILFPLLSAMVLAPAGCSLKSSLPELGQVPRFVLTAQSGKPFDSSALTGKVWVADFIYTTCTGPCPRMTSLMHRLQEATRNLGDVRLVSFTVDPETDTPAVLNEYAQRFRADPARWVFLTGPMKDLRAVSYDAFHLGETGSTKEHSTRFALVDKKGRIRGYYLSNDATALQQLVDDVGSLEKEVL